VLFRLVHYLPIAHSALALFAMLGAVLIMASSAIDTGQPGMESLVPPATVCRWLAVAYLAVAALLQFRLGRSGHNLIAQPSRTWVLLVAEQIMLTVLLAAVLVRGPTSRLQMAGFHDAVAVLLVVALVSLALAVIDRMVAGGVAHTLGEWDEPDDVPEYSRLNGVFIAVAALLFLSAAFVEAQPLPNSAQPQKPEGKVAIDAPREQQALGLVGRGAGAG